MEGGVHAEQDPRLGHAEFDLDRQGRDLWPDLGAGGPTIPVLPDQMLVASTGVAQQGPVGEGSSGGRLQAVQVVDGELGPGGHLHHAEADVAEDPAELGELGLIGEPARDGAAIGISVGGREAGGEPGAAGQHGLLEHGTHPVALLGRRDALERLLAHDVEPQGGVAHVDGVVEQRSPAPHGGQVIGKGLEIPRDTGGQAVAVHVLDVFEDADHRTAVRLAGGGDGQAAVAGDDGGHAVEGGRGQVGVPEDLGVVVGVDVDETGADDLPGGVEVPAARRGWRRWR